MIVVPGSKNNVGLRLYTCDQHIKHWLDEWCFLYWVLHYMQLYFSATRNNINILSSQLQQHNYRSTREATIYDTTGDLTTGGGLTTSQGKSPTRVNPSTQYSWSGTHSARPECEQACERWEEHGHLQRRGNNGEPSRRDAPNIRHTHADITITVIMTIRYMICLSSPFTDTGDLTVLVHNAQGREAHFRTPAFDWK